MESNLQAPFFVFRQHDAVAVCPKGGTDAANKGKQATKFGRNNRLPSLYGLEIKYGGIIMSNENKQSKPDCPLIGEDGNIFNLVGIAAKTLRRNGMSAEASEMTEKVFGSGSYEEALGIIGEYVNITSVDEPGEDMDMRIG